MIGKDPAIKKNVYLAKAFAKDDDNMSIIFVVIIENSIANGYISKNNFLNAYNRVKIF
jgi:hypothetical protein